MDYKYRIEEFSNTPASISAYDALLPGEMEYIRYLGYSKFLHPAVISIEILKEIEDYEGYIKRHSKYIKEHRGI